MVVAEEDADHLQPIVLDLLAQAEHGPGTLVIGVVDLNRGSGDPGAGSRRGPETGAVIRLIHAPTLQDALALAEAFAPEHLQLVGAGAEALSPRSVGRAACSWARPRHSIR